MKKVGWVFLSLISLIGFSFYFDWEIVQFFSLFRFEVIDSFLLGLTFLSSDIIIFFFFDKPIYVERS